MTPEPDRRVKKYFEETERIIASVGLVDGLISNLYDRFELIDSLKIFTENERLRKKSETTKDILTELRLNSDGPNPLKYRDLMNGTVRYLATRIRVEPEKKDIYLEKIKTVLPYIENHMKRDNFPSNHNLEGDIQRISEKASSQYPYDGNIWMEGSRGVS